MVNPPWFQSMNIDPFISFVFSAKHFPQNLDLLLASAMRVSISKLSHSFIVSVQPSPDESIFAEFGAQILAVDDVMYALVPVEKLGAWASYKGLSDWKYAIFRWRDGAADSSILLWGESEGYPKEIQKLAPTCEYNLVTGEFGTRAKKMSEEPCILLSRTVIAIYKNKAFLRQEETYFSLEIIYHEAARLVQ